MHILRTPGPRFYRYVPASHSWSIGEYVRISADEVARMSVEGRTE